MSDAETDVLSPLARNVIAVAPDGYRKLTVEGAAPKAAHQLLDGVMPDQLLVVPIGSYPHAAAMLSGLWLWHDALHECHEIAQKSPADLLAMQRLGSGNAGERGRSGRPDLQVATSTLAFWHAIMHRREGDFWNSKYWYARCRNHPALGDVAARVGTVLASAGEESPPASLTRGGWNPDALVDWVEQVHAGRSLAQKDLAVKLQRVEWQALFDYCTQQAAG